MDPYEENEVKGTRIPDYSKVSADRDIFGELGWIPNFNVKKSKNNNDRHDNFREFFDQPKDYNVEFTQASRTQGEFFRANGATPEESISMMKSVKSHQSRSPTIQHDTSFAGQTRRSLNALERLSYSAARDSKNKTFSHGFVLMQDISNKHKTSPVVVDTVKMPNSIPFLRDPRTNSNAAFQRVAAQTSQGFKPTVGYSMPRQTRQVFKEYHNKKIKESGWNQYTAPISKINERVHSSQRTPFEKI